MGWMDVLIIVILLINSVRGWMRGLVISIFQVVGFLVAGVVAKKYYSVVSTFLLDQPIVSGFIQGQISDRIQPVSKSGALPGSIVAEQNIFQSLNLPQWLGEWFASSGAIQDTGFLSVLLSEIIADFISIFAVFIAAKVVLSMIGTIFNSFGKRRPLLKKFNQFGGLLFGFTKGLVIVFILFWMLVPVLVITGNPVITEGLEKSIVAKAAYDYNPIAQIIRDGRPSI